MNDSPESFKAEARLCLKKKEHDAQRPSSDLGLVLHSDTCRLLLTLLRTELHLPTPTEEQPEQQQNPLMTVSFRL